MIITIDENKNTWENIMDNLIANGISCFSPNTHSGQCIENYVVVKDSGSAKHLQLSTSINYIDIMCFVPSDKYSALMKYKDEVQLILKELKPNIMPTGAETEPFYDDISKSYMVSVMYRYFKRDKDL